MQALLFQLPTATHINKGRNSTKLKMRNQHLVKRFYYWHELKRMRRDDVVGTPDKEGILSIECFLQYNTVRILLSQNYQLIKQIKKDRPTEKQLDGYSFPSLEVA